MGRQTLLESPRGPESELSRAFLIQIFFELSLYARPGSCTLISSQSCMVQIKKTTVIHISCSWEEAR